MSWNFTVGDPGLEDPVEKARAVQNLLDFIRDELERLQIEDGLILVEAAQEAIEQWMDEQDPIAALLAQEPGIED